MRWWGEMRWDHGQLSAVTHWWDGDLAQILEKKSTKTCWSSLSWVGSRIHNMHRSRAATRSHCSVSLLGLKVEITGCDFQQQPAVDCSFTSLAHLPWRQNELKQLLQCGKPLQSLNWAIGIIFDKGHLPLLSCTASTWVLTQNAVERLAGKWYVGSELIVSLAIMCTKVISKVGTPKESVSSFHHCAIEPWWFWCCLPTNPPGTSPPVWVPGDQLRFWGCPKER